MWNEIRAQTSGVRLQRFWRGLNAANQDIDTEEDEYMTSFQVVYSLPVCPHRMPL